MAIPVFDRIQRKTTIPDPVRDIKSDEIRVNMERNPINIYIGTYSMRILVLTIMRANNPSIMAISSINKF
jgi:hypothetical protein